MCDNVMPDKFLEFIKSRRSVRSYSDQPLPEGAIEKILEAARWGMSGANAQPWEFIAVKDPKIKAEIVKVLVDRRDVLKIIDKSFPQPPQDYTPAITSAPVFIVVCGDPRLKAASPRWMTDGEREIIVACGLQSAMHNIFLAAAALGLGGAQVTLTNLEETSLKELLGIPYEFYLRDMIPIGYPKNPPRDRKRRELSAFVHYDKLDRSKLRTDEEIKEFIESNTAHGRTQRSKIDWKDRAF